MAKGGIMEWFLNLKYDSTFFDKVIAQSRGYGLDKHIHIKGNCMAARFPRMYMECVHERIEEGLVLNFARYNSTGKFPDNVLVWLPQPEEEYFLLKLELSDCPTTLLAYEKMLSKTACRIPQSFLVSSAGKPRIRLSSEARQDILLVGISMSRDFLLYYLDRLFPSYHPVLQEVKTGKFRYHTMQVNQAIFEKIKEFHKTKTLFSIDKLAMKAFVYGLLDQYFRKLGDHPRGEIIPAARYYMDEMNHARETLVQALTSEIPPPSVREISREVGMSERKFESLFKAAYGMTYYNFFVELRMKRAGELLAEGNCSVSEVARMVGYQHLGHFSNIFKRYYGCLPRDFRI